MGAQTNSASPEANHKPTQQVTQLADSTVKAAGGYEQEAAQAAQHTGATDHGSRKGGPRKGGTATRPYRRPVWKRDMRRYGGVDAGGRLWATVRDVLSAQ